MDEALRRMLEALSRAFAMNINDAAKDLSDEEVNLCADTVARTLDGDGKKLMLVIAGHIEVTK